MRKDFETGALKAFNFSKLLQRVPELKQLDCEIETFSFKHISKNGKLIEKEIYFETESFKNFVIYLNEYGFKIINEEENSKQTQAKRSVCYTC